MRIIPKNFETEGYVRISLCRKTLTCVESIFYLCCRAKSVASEMFILNEMSAIKIPFLIKLSHIVKSGIFGVGKLNKRKIV